MSVIFYLLAAITVGGALAAVLLVMSGAGFWHLRRTNPADELLSKRIGATSPASPVPVGA